MQHRSSLKSAPTTHEIQNNEARQVFENKNHTDTCKCFECEPETFDHLLKCNHQASEERKTKQTRSVRGYCRSKSAKHNFQCTLAVAIVYIRSDQAFSRAQSRIGCTQFLKGFLTSQRSDYRDNEFRRLVSSSPPFGSVSFFSGLIKTV